MSVAKGIDRGADTRPDCSADNGACYNVIRLHGAATADRLLNGEGADGHRKAADEATDDDSIQQGVSTLRSAIRLALRGE